MTVKNGRLSILTFHIPEDKDVLAALGEVALRHEHLHYVLRMTLKSLAGVSVEEALLATRFTGSRELRQRVRRFARKRLGDGAALIQLQAFLEKSERLSEARNELVHGLYAADIDGGDAHVRDDFGVMSPVPTVAQLRALAAELERLANELNVARLRGFLAAALSSKPDQPNRLNGEGEAEA